MEKTKVAIIGLGLMGGSMAKALKKSGKYIVCGFDINSEVLALARAGGSIDEIWDGISPLLADITVLAVNPLTAMGLLDTLPPLLKEGSIITDICGIKEEIVEKGESVCDKVYFVGSHPMAGRELSGYSYSVPDLFFGRSYIITKTENTHPDAVEKLTQMAIDMGCADVTVTSPAYHDKMIAYTSQLPHILAGAYMNSPTSASHKGYSAGSYHDVSRVASVDEGLWTQLFLANKENLLFELDILIKNLEDYRSAVAESDQNRLTNIIKTGRILKQRDITVNGNEKPHKFG